MEKFIVKGGNKLKGNISVSGAKNVALKAIVAACLTDEEVIIKNIPLISDVLVMTEIVESLGGKVKINDHTLSIKVEKFCSSRIPLDRAAAVRTSFMLMIPLIIRCGKAIIPNPGGCRIGARPIDRIVDGLKLMGVDVVYDSEDGYFHASANQLIATKYFFTKNTHTGTETLILAASLAKGRTILENAAEEPEIDELIDLLNQMGANIKRVNSRTIIINGVNKLHGATFTIRPDRNEIVTFATAAIITHGDISIRNTNGEGLKKFIEKLKEAGGGVEQLKNKIRFYYKGQLRGTDVTTLPYPGFMTDWQGAWAVLMTMAEGVSIIHESVYENRFGYVSELKKMGANIKLFNPVVANPQEFYNFNLDDDKKEYSHAAEIIGPTKLHNAVVDITDLRAGATLVLSSLAAKGESIVFGIEHLDRGYEKFEERLKIIGADIRRVSDE